MNAVRSPGDGTGSTRRVEHHLGTVVTLCGRGLPPGVADAFFERVEALESILSRFRPDTELSRVADGRLDLDDADPAVREVLTRCADLRRITDGAFEHEPRRRSGDPGDPVLDPNAFAKGWIVDEAARVLRSAAVGHFFVNAGGDVLVARTSSPARVGVQHPREPRAVCAILEVERGAVATSGTYERGDHIRGRGTRGRAGAGTPTPGPDGLTSVTVVGPDLAEADALATAVFATGDEEPSWWHRVGGDFGLLTVTAGGRLRWRPPTAGEAHGARLARPSVPAATAASVSAPVGRTA